MKKAICVVIFISILVGNIQSIEPVYGSQIDKNSLYAQQIIGTIEEEEKQSVTDLDSYDKNEVIVVYKEADNKNSVHAFQQKKENVETLTEQAVLLKLEDKAELEDTLQELEKDESVAYIQPNYTYHALGAEDANYNLQWGLHNDGTFQYVTSRYTTVKSLKDIDINAPEAWELWDKAEQREVIVAVVDTGIKYDHEELTDSMWINEGEIPGDGIDNDNNGYIDDVHGWNFYGNNETIYNTRSTTEDSHGTHGAGSIIAKRNATGIAGIASNGNVKVMSVKALGGRDGSGSTEDLVRAIEYAERNGASICNLSLGSEEDDTLLRDTIKNSNMLFVVAAGNGDEIRNIGYSIDQSPMYPASYDYDNIISVGNIECTGFISSSSNYGVKSVDLVAPGSYIYSTSTAKSGYEYMTGTSMAAPMVSAVAAMVYSCHTDISLYDVKVALLDSVKKVSGLETKVLSGGMLDCYAALQYYEIVQKVTPAPTELVTEEPKTTAIPDTQVPISSQPPVPTQVAATNTPALVTQRPTVSPVIISTPEITSVPTNLPVTQIPVTSTPIVTQTPMISETPATEAPIVTKVPATIEPTATKTPTVSQVITVKVPTGLKLKLTIKKNTAKVKVSWKKVAKAKGYVLYRATAKKGTYKKIKTITSVATLSYIDKKVVKGKRYYYKIRAYKKVDGKKVYSKYSAIKNVKIKK